MTNRILSLAAAAFILSVFPAVAAPAPCKCEWHKANSTINTDATCYVDEDKRSECRLDWRLKGTSSPVPPSDARSDNQLINSITVAAQRARVNPAMRGVIEPMGTPGFWLNFQNVLRKRMPASEEGPLFDSALDFLGDPETMRAEPNLVAPAVVYVTYTLVRRRMSDNDQLPPMERSLNVLQRQRFSDALFGQFDRLTAFDGRGPPDKFLDEGKGDKLPDGNILNLNVMARIGPGCFEIWTDQEVASAYMVKAAWSPIRVGRCG